MRRALGCDLLNTYGSELAEVISAADEMLRTAASTGCLQSRLEINALPKAVSIAEIVRTTAANYSRMTEMITPYNRATFYGGEEKGYTDYPAHDELTSA